MTERHHWEVAGNLHLFAHIMRTVPRRPYRLGWRPECEDSPEYRANVRQLVAAKDAWVNDMVDLAQNDGEVPVAMQRTIWKDYIDRAEAEITKRC
jgi:hypothetical protein